MIRVVVAITFLVFGVAQAADVSIVRTINLDVPGTVEKLSRSNPVHHGKILKIITGLQERSDPEVPRWIQTSFDARDVQYAPLLLVTAPPKRRLSFTIDDTRYETVITR